MDFESETIQIVIAQRNGRQKKPIVCRWCVGTDVSGIYVVEIAGILLRLAVVVGIDDYKIREIILSELLSVGEGCSSGSEGTHSSDHCEQQT